MLTVTRLNRIKESVKSHLKSGDLELVVLPRAEYEALLEKLEDLQDIHDSLDALKEYESGKSVPFERYETRRRTNRVQDRDS